MNMKEVKAALMIPGTKFTVNGLFSPGSKKELTSLVTIDYMDEGVTMAIGVDFVLSTQSMNVNKFGPTCVTLYSYDMLGNKTTGKIKYEDVTIVVDSE